MRGLRTRSRELLFYAINITVKFDLLIRLDRFAMRGTTGSLQDHMVGDASGVKPLQTGTTSLPACSKHLRVQNKNRQACDLTAIARVGDGLYFYASFKREVDWVRVSCL